MKKISLLYLLLICCILSYANKNDSIKIKENEKLIKNLFSDLKKSNNNFEKENINNKIYEIFKNTLKINFSFYYPFDSLSSIGKIYSKDSLIRIYTWNLPLEFGTHKYFGFIQYKIKTDSILLIELPCCNKNSLNENTIKIDKWYGALYYDIIDVTTPDKFKYYVLLGFDFNSILTNKKIIDVLFIDNNGELNFGLPVFFYNNKWVNRIVFEYSARVSMVLKYDNRLNMIVYDHLSPSHLMYIGKYQFYGPDFSYDGLKLQNGKWFEVKDIDIRNP